MEGQEIEVAPNLLFDNRRVISGYPLRTEVTPVNGPVVALTNSIQKKQFEFGSSGIVARPDTFAFDIAGVLKNGGDPTAVDTSPVRMRALVKQLLATSMILRTKGGKEVANLTEILYRMPMQFYGNSVLIDQNYHEIFGGGERAIISWSSTNAAGDGDTIFKLTMNLGRALGAVFNSTSVWPLSEVMILYVDIPSMDQVSYLYSTATSGATTAVAQMDRIYHYRYKTIVDGSDNALLRPATRAQFTLDTVSTPQATIGVNAEVQFTKFQLSYEIERNEKVVMMMTKMVADASGPDGKSGPGLVIPYDNYVCTPYFLNGGQSTFTITHRVVASAGPYLKCINLTLSYPTDQQCLINAGSFNTSYIGNSRLQRVDVKKNSKNIVAYNIEDFEHESKNFGISTLNTVDNALERQYLLAAPANADTVTHNNSRFRVIPKESFFLPVYFEDISDKSKGMHEISKVSGEMINGDAIITVGLTFASPLPAGGAMFRIFQEGVNFLHIKTSMIEVA